MADRPSGVIYRRLPGGLEALNRARVDLRLAAFGFLWTVAQVTLGLDLVGFGHLYEASTVAANLAASGEFRDPFGVASGPTAHVAPMYPAILAAALKIFGTGRAFTVSMVVLNAALIGLAAGMMPSLSIAVFGTGRAGVAGGILIALGYRLMPQWEIALSAVLMIAATHAALRSSAIRAGVWSGISALTNPVAWPVTAAMGIGRGRRFAVTAAAVSVAVCAPWIFRNWVELGFPYFVRDNLGLELYVSNNDEASAELVANRALWTRHPNQLSSEAERVASAGEARYNREREREAMQWIGSHPGRFARLCAQRVWFYWLPSSRQGWQSYFYCAITILAVCGIRAARGNPAARAIALGAVVYSLPFIVVQTNARYRYPSLWTTALLAGYFLSRWRAKKEPKTVE